jgi:hypothetical protein
MAGRAKSVRDGNPARAAPRLSWFEKVGGRFPALAGCSDAETAAITGQSRDMVEHYAKQVNQKRLAAAAILKLEAADAAWMQNADEDESVQPAVDLVQLGRSRRN